jgi:hypothetical protein
MIFTDFMDTYTLLILCSTTMCSTQAASGLTREYLTRNKHVSLFWRNINEEEKKFYDKTPGYPALPQPSPHDTMPVKYAML